MYKYGFFIYLWAMVTGCTVDTYSIESEYVKVKIMGSIYEEDWLEVNEYKIEFVLPDTTKAIAFTTYNPYFLEVSDNNKIGFISPTTTYEAGPGKPVKKVITKGAMLLNIGKILNLLSYTECDSSIFDFKTDKIATLNGLFVFGMTNGEPVKVRYPQNMNILVEPYQPKE